MSFLIYLALFTSISIPLSSSPVSSSCVEKCDVHATQTEFETCVSACTATTTSSTTQATKYAYPSAPFNITVQMTVTIENNVKFLEATVEWDFLPDKRRTGFYLRMTALGELCEKDFPGYYALNIDPLSTSHQIPLYTGDSQHLDILHDCTYHIEMHSKPYPYSDKAYASSIRYTVPTCLDNYCSCLSEPNVPEPSSVQVIPLTIRNQSRVMVNWTHVPASRNHSLHHFHFQLAQRFYHNVARLKEASGFRYRLTQMSHSVIAEPNQTSFSTILPLTLKLNEEYKVILFAQNDQICNSNDVTVAFNNTIGRTYAYSPGPRITSIDASLEEFEPNFPTKATPYPTTEIGMGPEAVLRNHSMLIVVLMAVTAICLFGCCCVVCCMSAMKRSQKKQKMLEMSSIVPWSMVQPSHSQVETNILYTAIDALERRPSLAFDISFESLAVGSMIGQGAFGTVYMGTARGVNGYSGQSTVAIKQLNANADECERREFLVEMNIMKLVGRHPNIVALYACCRDESRLCMVMEYVPFGDLKNYLQNLRKQLDRAVEQLQLSLHQDVNLPPSLHASFIANSEPAPPVITDLQYSLDSHELQSFAAQVASGMAHIEALGITHRDLAARNILVGHGKQLKISDFGLSRHGVYVKTTKGVIPLRWLSLEAIRENTYSTKSDVWAYGIVLWEICTLAAFPYSSFSDAHLVQYLESGGRLEKPTSCSDQLYELMLACWAANPDQRPTFAFLNQHISQMNNQQCPYVDFIPTGTSDLVPPDGYCALAEDETVGVAR